MPRIASFWPALLALVVASGCTGLGSVAQRLGDAIASQPDPAIVRQGLPSYLILADTLAEDSPEDASTQFAAARLYSLYGGSFVDADARKRQLTERAYDYARRGLCLRLEAVCEALDAEFPTFRQALQGVDEAKGAQALYRFASVWSTWVQARSDDYTALADLPRIEATLKRVLALRPEIDHGFAHVYYGVLLAQRPAALGGQPKEAKHHFERAIAISDGRNLMAKTLYAEHYARLEFDRELHQRLVTDVLTADAQAGDLTLANTLAQRRARELRASADAFF